MDIIKARNLFAPPDKMDSTKVHLTNMVNKGFETLAMELCEIVPNSPILDSMVNELHKIRLQINFEIEHAKTGKKEEAAPVVPPKKARGPKNPVVPSAPIAPQNTVLTPAEDNNGIDNENDQEQTTTVVKQDDTMEGFD